MGARAKKKSNLLAMVLSLVTGMGHLYLGHALLGALLFVSFLAAVNGALLGAVLQTRPLLASTLSSVCPPLAAALWLFGLLHALRLTFLTNRAALARRVRASLASGLACYIRGELGAAREHLERAVRSDIDWQSSDACFYLGVVSLRLGDRRAARHAFRECLLRDEGTKWWAEISLECADCREALPGLLMRLRAVLGGAAKEAR